MVVWFQVNQRFNLNSTAGLGRPGQVVGCTLVPPSVLSLGFGNVNFGRALAVILNVDIVKNARIQSMPVLYFVRLFTYTVSVMIIQDYLQPCQIWRRVAQSFHTQVDIFPPIYFDGGEFFHESRWGMHCSFMNSQVTLKAEKKHVS